MRVEQRFAAVRLAPRPPRVAIIIPGDECWDYWVRLAMFTASTRWGGAGFVVVPHEGGAVSPHLLEALVVYDPDFVVELQPTLRQLEAASPGSCDIRSAEGRMLEGQERLAVINSVANDPVSLSDSEIARDNIARVCTPHRQSIDGHEPSEHVEVLEVTGRDDNIPTCPQRPDTAVGLVACPPGWSGRLAAAVAALVGATTEPRTGAEPTLDVDAQRRLATMLLASSEDRPWKNPPEALVQPGELPADGVRSSALEQTSVGVIRVTRDPLRDRTNLIVAGDTANDFALAMIWDRIYGTSLWLPSELQPSAQNPQSSAARMALSRRIEQTAQRGDSVHIASCSLDDTELMGIVEDWGLDDAELSDRRSMRAEKKRRGGIVFGLPRPPSNGVTMLAVPEQYDRFVSLPVNADGEGTLQLPVALPTVVPHESSLTAELPSRWQIDVEFTDGCMPRGRGIDGASLVHDEDPSWDAWVRSGRDGLCVHSHRFGLVLAGSSLEATVAKPRVREHGLLPWVQQMAIASGYTAERSDAGLRAQVAERIFGGRERLIDAMAGPLRAVLRHFRPSAARSSDAYPSGHGVVLGPDGYLTFEGIKSVADELEVGDLRLQIDQLLETGVLTRGLILGCSGCRKPAFVAVDHIGQDNECPRCGEVWPLAQARWRQPQDEPVWYYRLHWSLAELFDQNGDVPLLLSHALRDRARSRYSDMGEIEFANGGGPVAECDLIALRRHKLLIAEAKTTDSLDVNGNRRRRSANKRVQIAAALQADEVILATTQAAWQPSSIGAMSAAIAGHSWPTGRGPLLRVVTGLGHAPQQQVFDPHQPEHADADVTAQR